MKKLFLIFLMVFFSAGWCSAETVTSGTLTVVERGSQGSTWTEAYTWTSDTGGNVVVSNLGLTGQVCRVVFSDDGTSVPTALYDVDLLDFGAVNVLGTGGDNVTTGPVEVEFDPPLAVYGEHGLVIENAGDTKRGTVRVYLRR